MRFIKEFSAVMLLGLLALLGAVIFAQEKPTSVSGDEANAVGASRTINTAEVTYAATYNIGFSVNLLVLGGGPPGSQPTEMQAGLIAKGLAQGTWHNYTFTYKPGPKDKHGIIISYSLVVGPVKWHKDAASFYTDQSGVIRSTRENRAPTANDKPLGE